MPCVVRGGSHGWKFGFRWKKKRDPKLVNVVVMFAAQPEHIFGLVIIPVVASILLGHYLPILGILLKFRVKPSGQLQQSGEGKVSISRVTGDGHLKTLSPAAIAHRRGGKP
ncbi:MAG: hypothetical protein WA655_11590 [Candidatus Korobacteraceae bacterium]